jgi:hypothetical protein
LRQLLAGLGYLPLRFHPCAQIPVYPYTSIGRIVHID